MYEVKFKYEGKVTLPFTECIVVADLERALALASLLQKISTENVKFVSIIVEPFKICQDEKKEK